MDAWDRNGRVWHRGGVSRECMITVLSNSGASHEVAGKPPLDV